MQRILSMERNGIPLRSVIRLSKTLLCLTAILTNSNHQHNGMEGTKLIKNVIGL